jgi:biopolymer transport protein ExbB
MAAPTVFRPLPRHVVVLVLALLFCAIAFEASAAEPAGEDSLVAALGREKALLRAENEALQTRQRASAQRAQEELSSLRQAVARQRSRYEAAYADVLRLERELRDVDARMESSPVDQTTDAAPLADLERSLDLKTGGEDTKAERLERAVRVAASRIVSRSRVWSEEEQFFLPDGELARGTVVRVGVVGAAGVTQGGQGGVIVPTDESGGRYQLVESDPEAVRAYLEGESARLPLLVFNPSHPPDPDEIRAESPDIEPDDSGTWRDTVEDAAPVGYVIIALGFLAVLVALSRLVRLAWLTLTVRSAGDALLDIMHEEDEERELEDLQRYAREHPNALSRVTLQALSHRTLPLELYENSVQATLLVEIANIGRGLSALRAIAAVSPLLGLLGTVIGMIATFQALTAAGHVGDPQALSGGIAQALATTQLGLIVAVPALLSYSVLRGWASRMQNYVEHVAVEISTHIRELSLESSDPQQHHHDH